ncbi:MAG: CHASE2 domain-containing protein [Synechococcales bacterium]|nr:CHASE2 domain-containing protein [Synechococcales bacterium]
MEAYTSASQEQNPTIGDITITGNIQGSSLLTFNQTQIIQVTGDKVKNDPLNLTSPYRSLKKFEPSDKDLFFGRDQFLKGLVDQLEKASIVLLLGASGSGKSSVVRAGLIPWLAKKWGKQLISLMFMPDRDPFESLYGSLLAAQFGQLAAKVARVAEVNTLTRVVAELKQPDDFWLIFIDQFEELFTMSDPETCRCFIDSLVHLGQTSLAQVKVVATMRADFLDRLSSYPDLVTLTDSHRPVLSAMRADELRMAIEQPAAHHGVVFENGLVEEIIKNVQRQAGCLPLLQYTLDLLWQSEVKDGGIHDRTLNTVSYRQLGGVRGALQQRADEIYAHLSEPEKLAAQRLFLKLVEIGGDAESGTEWKPVRRRAKRSEFSDQIEADVLVQLINDNLLVSDAAVDGATVEIAHEILLTSWDLLQTWIQENRQAIALRNRLYDDVRLWIKENKRDDDLWSGAKLARVIELEEDPAFTQVVGNFSPEAIEFVNASKELIRRKEYEQKQREYKQKQRELKIRIAAGDDRRAALVELLEACTVKLSLPGQAGAGTGFFVAPGKILTCDPKVAAAGAQPIQVTWQDREQLNVDEATIDRLFPSHNLVVLKLASQAIHPCVYLDDTASNKAPTCTYGYVGEFVTGGYGRGRVQRQKGKNRGIIEFETYQDSFQLQSSPLLNLETSKVCGIVQSTHYEERSELDRDVVTVGNAISAANILATDANLRQQQKEFHKHDQRWRELLPPRCKPRTVALTSLGMATLVILVRAFQVFQPLELGFYDALMRSRLNPPKPSDRFLIVHITKEDADAQRERGEVLDYSLSNKTLLAFLGKIEAMADNRKPIAVGLDIYRDEALAHLDPTGKQRLETLFKESDTLFTVCKSPDSEGHDGVSPPPGTKAEQVGFSDFSLDDGDKVLRRHLLAFNIGASANSPCKPPTPSDQSIQSFNLLIANRYLQHYWQKQEPQITVDSSEQTCQIQFSNGVTLPNLPLNTGGYQGYAGEEAAALFSGCQILLNYRHPHQQYQTISLQKFLDSDLSSQDYSNRIILIGINRSDGIGDNVRTPYDQRSDDMTTGVIIHAHMIDQVIDAAIEGPSTLIWVLPSPIDLLLILTAALIGGGLGWCFLSPRRLGIWVIISGGSLFLISVTVFQFGGWVPLMPHFLALSATSGYVFWANMRLRSVTAAQSAKSTSPTKATSLIELTEGVKP